MIVGDVENVVGEWRRVIKKNPAIVLSHRMYSVSWFGEGVLGLVEMGEQARRGEGMLKKSNTQQPGRAAHWARVGSFV